MFLWEQNYGIGVNLVFFYIFFIRRVGYVAYTSPIRSLPAEMTSRAFIMRIPIVLLRHLARVLGQQCIIRTKEVSFRKTKEFKYENDPTATFLDVFAPVVLFIFLAFIFLPLRFISSLHSSQCMYQNFELHFHFEGVRSEFSFSVSFFIYLILSAADVTYGIFTTFARESR